MSKKRSFRLPDGEVVDVSAEEGDALLEIEPKAVEVKSFLVDKDTVDVGLDEVNQLLEIAPNAKPLFEDEPTKDFTKQIADVKPFDMAESVKGTPPPANMELGIPPAPTKEKELDLDDKTKAALNKSFSNFPINVLGNKKAREVFYNSYAKSRNLNPAQLRDYGERLAADTLITKGDELVDKGDIKGAEQLYLSQVGKRTETALDRLSKMYAMSGDKQKAQEYAAELDKFQKGKLSQVGTGSYKQPSYFPTELGFAGKQGETIEGDQGGKFYKDMERTSDTEETASSKYLKDIRDTNAWLLDAWADNVVKPSGEMMKAGSEKYLRGEQQAIKGQTLEGFTNSMYGIVQMLLGAAGVGTISGQAFTAGLTQGQKYAPKVVEKAMWGSHYIAPYLEKEYGFSKDMAENVGLTLDIGTAMALHIGYKMAKGEIASMKAAALNEKDLDARAAELFKQVPPEEFHRIVDEAVTSYKNNPETYTELVKENNAKAVEAINEAAQIAEGKQEVAPIESQQATFLPELKEGTNVEFTTKNGKESGVIDRLDDGTWVFENENGVTEIPVKDKTNPTETLQELGIDITPEVAPEQVAKAEADAERTGWVTDKGKTYFVSLGNPKIEGSYDLVFERNSQGGLTNRFDSSADPVFAEGRKLKLINKLLEKEGLPKRDKVNQPPIKGKVEQVQKVEPTVEEVKPVEAIKEEVATTVQEAPTVEAAEVVQEPAAVETTEVTPQKPIIEAEKPTVESTITEPVSEVKVVEEVKPVEEPNAKLPKEETKGSLLNDIRKFNSLSKKDRQTVGANLKAKIMEGASKIEHSVSYDNKGKLILLNKEGKRAKASPKKISDEAKQANKARVESARKALSKTPSTLREWLLQLLLSKQSVSASDLKRATGFSPKEFPAFTVGEKGTTFHDLMEMVQGDPELSHILREYTDNVGFDNQKFDSDIADIMTSIENRESMWRELMEENKENAWRDQGFANKSEYEWALELQVEAERLGVDIEDVKESHIAEAENITKYMEEEDIVKMLQDLDENAPKTIEEINKFYENNNIEQAEVNSEISSTSSVKREVSEAEIKLEKAKAELKNKRKQLLETLLEDNENLFGEKKSSEGKLFDEKADASKMDEALAPFIEKVKEAERELEQSKKVAPKDESQTSITSDVGKEVEFNHAGQDRVGTIVGEEGNNYVIESEVGSRKNTYTYPKDKAKVIEPLTPEEQLQSRRNLTTIANNNGLAFSVPSDLPQKAMKFFKKMFNNTDQLPKEVFDLKVAMKGELAAKMTDIKWTVNKFNKAVQKVYNQKLAKIPASEFVKIDKYLKGDRLVTIDPQIKSVLDNMRDQIDNLSRELINLGLVDGDLSIKISQNEGVYVTRTFRAFDGPEWAKKVPEDIKNKAIAFLRSKYPNATPLEIDGIINSLLYERDAPMQLLSQGKLGKMDLNILSKRKEIPLEIRQLLGEYNDPVVNYAKSVYKINSLIANSKFLKDTYDAGINKFLFENRTGDYFVQIASSSNKSYNPLSGLYTTPELAEAFNQVKAVMKGDDIWNTAFRSYMTVNAAIKAGKTIGSIQTHARNVVSNINFLVANGNLFNPKKAAKAWDTVKSIWRDSGVEQQKEYIKKLQRLGVLDDGANAMEMLETIKDASSKYDDVDAYLNNNILSKVKKGTVKAYALEDSMFKVFAFECEKAKCEKVGLTPEQAEAKAAEIVRKTMPTYSLTPEIIKQLRRVPLVGTFVSFPAEVIRTYANTWQLAIKEMKDPITRDIGIQRAAGLIVATALTKGISEYSKYLWNVSDDEEKALRRMQPPWSKNSDYVIVGRDKNNVPIYVDLGYSDPYNYLKNPVNSIMFSDNPTERAANGFYELLKPFISEEMLSGRLMDVRSNKKSTGGQIYNEQEPLGDQLSKIYQYMADVAEPGTITSLRRIYKGYKGETSNYGKQYDVDNEIIAMMSGQRVNKTNVLSNFSFKSKNFNEAMTDGKSIYNTAFYNKPDKEDVDYSYDVANDVREKLYNEFRKDYRAAIKLGATEADLIQAMRANRISKAMIISIIDNQPYNKFLEKE